MHYKAKIVRKKLEKKCFECETVNKNIRKKTFIINNNYSKYNIF